MNNMQTLTTHGVKVSVESFYQPAHSEPHRNRFLHVYNIQIDNQNDFSVQLLRRHWYIVESTGIVREVEGVGVINKQPVIDPGRFHAYTSYSILETDLGKMYGTYLMVRADTGEQFEVDIPAFILATPAKIN